MNNYFKPNTPDELAAAAALRGRSVIYPAPKQIFIDIDSEQDYQVYRKQLEILDSSDMSPVVIQETESATPGHKHIILTFREDFTPAHRIALQAAMGSDRKRELLAILKGFGPVCFFE